MKSLFNSANPEVILGGFFGLVAIVAILAEMAIAGFDTMSIASGIKDMAGTMVAVMIFIIAIQRLIPKKENLSFEEKLTKALNNWCETNSTLIVKSTDDNETGKYGFSMRTNITDFYRAIPQTNKVGWFVRMPIINEDLYNKKDLQIDFHLNKGTFFEGIELTKEELRAKYNELGNLFCGFINAKYSDFAIASQKDDNIRVVIRTGIQNDADISRFVDLLDSMVQAYLTSANIKV